MQLGLINGNGNENVVKFGIPKGSLQNAALSLLERAGFNFASGDRSYFPVSDDPEIAAAHIRAQEIAGYVEKGVFDLGITGYDWIQENDADVVEIEELSFSKQSMRPVKWVVAVPKDSDINDTRDLNGKRIATELVRTTNAYLKANGIAADVEFSWGATEVKAPILVDAIVEVTETGRSLKANNLRIVDTVLVSTPRMIANRESYSDPWKKNKIDQIAMLVKGATNAIGKVGLKFNMPRKMVETARSIIPAMKDPTISSLLNSEWVALEIIIEENKVRSLVPELKKFEACDIIEYPLKKVIY